MEFGKKLYRLRVERGVYQKQLASYLHVSVGTISNYENGVHSPDLKTLCRLAAYFRVSTDYLLDRTEYFFPIESLNQPLVNRYTTGAIVNVLLGLSPEGRQDLVKYLTMLAAYDKNGLPPLSAVQPGPTHFVPTEPEPRETEENAPEEE